MNFEELKSNLNTLNKEARIDELEKIKKEIQFIADKCLPNNLAEEFEVKGLKTTIEIIDNHIAKLRGEQK